MAIRVKQRENEPIELMIRRFKKMCEKEGLVRDLTRISYYEKPSEANRRKERQKRKRRVKAIEFGLKAW